MYPKDIHKEKRRRISGSVSLQRLKLIGHFQQELLGPSLWFP